MGQLVNKTIDAIAKDLETLRILLQRFIAGFSPFFLTLIAAANATALLGLLRISWGTYTPTLTNTTNVAASTSYLAKYIRVGDIVFVAGRLNIDPTAAAPTLTTLGVSLPIASDLTNSEQCSGVYARLNDATGGGVVTGDTTNNRANITFFASNAGNNTGGYAFAYQVL